MRLWVEKFTDKLVNLGIIEFKDRELYSFGLFQMGMSILNFITVVVIGILFGALLESIIFFCAYVLIRPYAGGYHARTHLRCYIFSVCMNLSVIVLIRFLPWTYIMCYAGLIISSIIIILLVPVEDQNKPLDEIECKVYRKRALERLFLLVVVSIFMRCIGNLNFMSCIVTALGMMAVMLLLGIMTNRSVGNG